MVKVETHSYLSSEVCELIKITDDVCSFVESSGIRDGVLIVISAHTTCGILVNEGLPCVEQDLQDLFEKVVPLDEPYAHAHFLPSYGATGNNSQGHLKQTLCGNSCMFPLVGGQVQRGSTQDIYLAEFDGPQRRTVFFEVMGE